MQRFFFTDAGNPMTPPTAPARRAPVRAATRDAAPAFFHGREMAPATVRRSSFDAETEGQSIEAPNMTQPTAAAQRAPKPGENTDAELVASFPPGHVRNPAGGAYGSMDNEEGHHVMFYPGAPLDLGKTTANGAATMDGKVIRTEDLNSVTRDTNAKNRAFWDRQQGHGR